MTRPVLRASARPLSPHLTIWRWAPNMAASIFHRATGQAMAIAGGVLLVTWLAFLASGADGYAGLVDVFTVDDGGFNIVGYVVLIGLSWSFFQHLSSGLRHLFLDTGAGYELRTMKTTASLTFVAGIVLTVIFWALILTGAL